ncbi:hypothetical protein ABK040_015095 [Willaertia magna]
MSNNNNNKPLDDEELCSLINECDDAFLDDILNNPTISGVPPQQPIQQQQQMKPTTNNNAFNNNGIPPTFSSNNNNIMNNYTVKPPSSSYAPLNPGMVSSEFLGKLLSNNNNPNNNAALFQPKQQNNDNNNSSLQETIFKAMIQKGNNVIPPTNIINNNPNNIQRLPNFLTGNMNFIPSNNTPPNIKNLLPPNTTSNSPSSILSQLQSMNGGNPRGKVAPPNNNNTNTTTIPNSNSAYTAVFGGGSKNGSFTLVTPSTFIKPEPGSVIPPHQLHQHLNNNNPTNPTTSGVSPLNFYNPTSFMSLLQPQNQPSVGGNFYSVMQPPPMLPQGTKGLMEVTIPSKPVKFWPKLLSELKAEVVVTNLKLWQALSLSPNNEGSLLRVYVPDFGNDYCDDEFEDDDDFDDEFEDEDLTGKRTRAGTIKKNTNNSGFQSFVYLFTQNKELVAYICSKEFNDCIVPLSKHKIIVVSASVLNTTESRTYINLKVYMIKKAFVSDKNLLESSEPNCLNATTANGEDVIDRLSDDQIQMYHIRKNFLKKLFDIIDRQLDGIGSSTSSGLSNFSLEPPSSSNNNFNNGDNKPNKKMKGEDDLDDDLDELDDQDLDEYIIQKPPTFEGIKGMDDGDKSLEKQLEELYDEIEKTVDDDDEGSTAQKSSNYDASYDSDNEDMEVPEDSVLVSELRTYQKVAVKWMLKRERVGEDKTNTPPKLHTLYQERKFPDGTVFYFNPLSGMITLNFVPAPPEPRGGILADEMGLGKTVEIIGLISSNRMKGQIPKTKPGEKLLTPATLIVTPLTIVDQWKHEVERHTNGQLQVYVYQGSRRIRDANSLLKYDVIITTYNTLSFEYSQTFTNKERTNAKKKISKETTSQPSPIYKMNFFRVVLDEAHNIKNRKSLQSRATAAVESERRWAVTGTPIQNHIDDLFSLFHFLKVNPHGDWRWWSKYIGKPFEKKDKKAIEALQSVIKKLVIRRTKNKKVNGKRIVMLPPKRIETVTLIFSEAEATFYKSLYEYSKGKFNEFVRSGTVLKNYANILEMLLHLRQVCNHPALIITSFQKKSEKSTMNGFLESFEQKNGYEVYDSILPMLPQVLKNNKERARLGDSATNQLKNINVTKYMRSNWRSSSKINALIEKLKELDYGTKSVVFSQWTSMLDLVEVALEKSKIGYVRLDGKMQRKDRDMAVQTFKKDAHISVCLISLKVGGTGLNLVWATHVFLLDPWWNPAIEEQAIDRVHRIGQDNPVTVFRFVVKDSVEERILSLQKSKTKIANEALNISTGSDDEDDTTTYTSSFLGGSFGGGALKRQYEDDEGDEEEEDEDEFNEVNIDDYDEDNLPPTTGKSSSFEAFGHTKKDAQKIRLKDLSTIFV